MAAVIGTPLPTQRPGGSAAAGKASESYGATGSLVTFDHRYLTGNGPGAGWNETASESHPPDTPAFWTGVDPPDDIGSHAHQAIPLIGFAHAAANSRLRKL
jgi:hypothetical protein